MNVVVVDFDSYSEEESGNDCFSSDGMDVLNVNDKLGGNQGPIEKEVSSEAKELGTSSTTNVKTVEPESPIVLCSNDCIFKCLSSKLIIQNRRAFSTNSKSIILEIPSRHFKLLYVPKCTSH